MKLESKFDIGQEVYFLTDEMNFQKGTIWGIFILDVGEDFIKYEYNIKGKDENSYAHICEAYVFRNKEEYIKFLKNEHEKELKKITKDFENKLKYAIENAENQYQKNLKAIEEMEF